MGMKVALLGNSAQSVLDFRSSLVRRLCAIGVEVDAYAPDYSDESKRKVEALGATAIDYSLQRSGLNPIADLKTIGELRRKLSARKPDAVLSYFVKPAIYGTLAAWLAEVPKRIAMLEGLGYGFATAAGLPLRQKAAAVISKRLLRIALKRAHVTLVLNEDDRNTITAVTGLAGSKIVNIGGIGVELDRFPLLPVSAPATTFAMAARLIAEKGVLEYVEAARCIKRSHPDAVFLLLGAVDLNPGSLKGEQIEQWVAEGIVEWPGRVDDVRAWLSRADVFVLPSYYREGVPRSTQEAMALGRAIITTDHVGCRETVDDGVNGFLIPVRDVGALVTAMKHFLDDRDLARSMGLESRRLAEIKFDAKRADGVIAKHLGAPSD